jgi:hypothetical protein
MFFSFSFLRVRACFPPRRALLSPFFFFSLSHCETPQLGCRSRVSSLLLSLEISPDQATRQLPSPNLKEITPNAASCRCGRGEKRTKEDALLGASIFGTSCRKHRALSTPPQACCPLKTSSVAKNSMCLSTTSKIRQREPRPLPSEPRKRRRGFGRHDIERFLRRRDFKRKKNKTLTCAVVAGQSRTSPTSSGSTAALDCMTEGLKKGSKGSERRKDKEAERKTSCGASAANCSVFPFETVSSTCYTLPTCCPLRPAPSRGSARPAAASPENPPRSDRSPLLLLRFLLLLRRSSPASPRPWQPRAATRTQPSPRPLPRPPAASQRASARPPRPPRPSCTSSRRRRR